MLGMEIRRIRTERTVELTQKRYSEQVLERFEKKTSSPLECRRTNTNIS